MSAANTVLKNKTTWWIVGGVGGLIILVFFIRLIVKYAPKQSLVDDITVNKENLSYPLVNYNMWAEQLYNAMEGSGTDEATIYKIFSQLVTLEDYNQLVKAFGVKKVSNFIYNFSGSLQSWLQNELNAKELAKVNSYINKFGVTI